MKVKTRALVAATLVSIVVGANGAMVGATENATTQGVTSEATGASPKIDLRDKLDVYAYDDSDVFALTDILASKKCSFVDALKRWVRVRQGVERYEFSDVELFTNYATSLLVEEETLVLVVNKNGQGNVTFDSTARPFVRVFGAEETKSHFDRLAKIYLSDEVDYSFIKADLYRPTALACDPAGASWSIWIEAPEFGTNNTDLNFYNMSETLFGGKYDGKAKAEHVAVLKKKAENEQKREYNIAKKAERSARAAARNAERVSRQNAVILNSRATQQRLNNQ